MIPFFNGLLLGILFIWQFGPGFFALVETSLQRGLILSIWVAIGISLNDFVYVALISNGYSGLISDGIRLWTGIGGAVLLVGFGIYTFGKVEKTKAQVYRPISGKSSILFLIKGFLINGLNPSVALFWVGMVALINVQYGYEDNDLAYASYGVVVTILISDIVKALLAFKLKSVLTPNTVTWINRSSGIALVIFGSVILYSLF